MATTQSDVDLADHRSFVDAVPHEYFARLRREDPVHWHEEPDGPGFWVLTRYADVVTVNRDAATFSSHRGGALLPTMPPEQLAQQQLMMLNMDPPQHTRLRKLVNKGFTPRMVSALEPHIREVANQIIDTVIEKGHCDFVTDIAAEMPLQVIAELLGWPVDRRHELFEWSNRMVGSNDPEYAVSPEQAQNAATELFMAANALAEERRSDPRDDIVSRLLDAEVEGEKLTEMDFDLFVMLLAVAGNETTRNLVSHAQLALMDNPDERQKLVDDPSLIPHAVEEMLRWGSPVMHFRRTATRDVEMHGKTIAENDKVSIWYISANRDETVFDDPYRFDVTRTPNEHIAFGGGGPHFCLGANLARLEIRVMFEELLRRTPDMELDGEVQRLCSNFINGIKHLPVAFKPGKPES